MEHFTPVSALIGGVLIGLSAGILWLVNGRIAGISGILGGIVPLRLAESGWRILFFAALILGTWLTFRLLPAAVPDFDTSLPRFAATGALLAGAGLLVGIGTRLSGGCTSGHGVCGLARLSTRSFAAVATFMATGAATVIVIRHLL